MSPLFSIITVTYNAESVIAPTLHSIAVQTCHDYELLIQDGLSSDDTLRIVAEAGIARTLVQKERDNGIYDAMNKAMERATGKYLIFLNAGDAFASPDTLQRIADSATGSPGIIYGQTSLVNSKRQVTGKRHLTAPRQLTYKSFSQGMVVCHQAFVARRDLCTPYDLTYRFSSDYDWCLKVLKKSAKNAYVGDEPIIHFLDDQSGTTARNHKASLKERYRIMCRNFGTVPTMLRHLKFAARHLTRTLHGHA